MRIGDALTDWMRSQTTKKESLEGGRHRRAKYEILELLRAQRACVTFTDGETEIQIVPPYIQAGNLETIIVADRVAHEVGWPGVMDNCEPVVYRRKFGCSPQWIFDIGVYANGRLSGVIEVTSHNHMKADKLDGIMEAGLWLVDFPWDSVSAGEWSDDFLTVSFPVGKVWYP